MNQTRRVSGRLAIAGLAIVAVGSSVAYAASAASADGKTGADLALLDRTQAAGDIAPQQYDSEGTLVDGSTRLLLDEPDNRVWVGLSEKRGVCVIAELRSDGDWMAGLTCNDTDGFNSNGLQIGVSNFDTRSMFVVLPDSTANDLSPAALQMGGLQRVAENLLTAPYDKPAIVEIGALVAEETRP